MGLTWLTTGPARVGCAARRYGSFGPGPHFVRASKSFKAKDAGPVTQTLLRHERHACRDYPLCTGGRRETERASESESKREREFLRNGRLARARFIIRDGALASSSASSSPCPLPLLTASLLLSVNFSLSINNPGQKEERLLRP